MIDKKELLSSLEILLQKIHQFPEPGWEEFHTTYLLHDALKNDDVEIILSKGFIVKDCIMGRPDEERINDAIEAAVSHGADRDFIDSLEGLTGFCAIIKTGNPGPVFGFRADIDCVEANEKQTLDHPPFKEGYASVRGGYSHSCGHDYHGVIGVGLAKCLLAHKNDLIGEYRIFFQPAEEGLRGAKCMALSHLMDNVDYFFGYHVGANASLGVSSSAAFGVLASHKFDVEFMGSFCPCRSEP